jgi:hypothetical protein
MGIIFTWDHRHAANPCKHWLKPLSMVLRQANVLPPPSHRGAQAASGSPGPPGGGGPAIGRSDKSRRVLKTKKTSK